ncbi:hypothetical protein L1987_85926 [Smallanthus sonchifolius]|uniref:Uncharacterized protein n=1 Tax=Smallanthus sonchifolius TaxID=185202 RepID=A0ACB8XXW0_9ASTR|nr:hypothetical protein L1987_85926 [Smallanthus sonchifolius]
MIFRQGNHKDDFFRSIADSGNYTPIVGGVSVPGKQRDGGFEFDRWNDVAAAATGISTMITDTSDQTTSSLEHKLLVGGFSDIEVVRMAEMLSEGG